MARKNRSGQSSSAFPPVIGDQPALTGPTSVRPTDRSRTWRDLVGMLKSDEPARSVEEMNAAITEEVRRRHARGRY